MSINRISSGQEIGSSEPKVRIGSSEPKVRIGSSEPKVRIGVSNFSSTSGSPIQVTDDIFKEEVLESNMPVLVCFWAPWCGPCRMVAPVVEEIAGQYAGQIKVAKVNTDENPSIASQYGIRSIPTLMIFVNGQRVDMIVGAVSKTTLADTLEKYF